MQLTYALRKVSTLGKRRARSTQTSVRRFCSAALPKPLRRTLTATSAPCHLPRNTCTHTSYDCCCLESSEHSVTTRVHIMSKVSVYTCRKTMQFMFSAAQTKPLRRTLAATRAPCHLRPSQHPEYRALRRPGC